MLQSKWRSVDGRWTGIVKSGVVGRLSVDIGTNFVYFWSANDFIVEAPKLKVSPTDLPIFKSFVVGEAPAIIVWWSTVSRRLFKEIYMISAVARPIIGRPLADYRQTVFRWHFIKEPSADRRQTSAVIRPMIARLSVDHKRLFCHIVYNACILIVYTKIICFCVWFLIVPFVWRFEINVSTSP